MPQYVALLRGIAPLNPNMRNEKLRAVFASLGFTDVKTVISSGNVLFASPRRDVANLETTIERALFTQLGFHSTTIIRSREQLQRLVQHHPFAGYEHGSASYLTVTFLKHKAPTSPPPWAEGHAFTVVAQYGRELCVVTNMTAAKTPDFMARAEKWLGKDITTRTLKTVERILERF